MPDAFSMLLVVSSPAGGPSREVDLGDGGVVAGSYLVSGGVMGENDDRKYKKDKRN